MNALERAKTNGMCMTLVEDEDIFVYHILKAARIDDLLVWDDIVKCWHSLVPEDQLYNHNTYRLKPNYPDMYLPPNERAKRNCIPMEMLEWVDPEVAKLIINTPPRHREVFGGHSIKRMEEPNDSEPSDVIFRLKEKYTEEPEEVKVAIRHNISQNRYVVVSPSTEYFDSFEAAVSDPHFLRYENDQNEPCPAWWYEGGRIVRATYVVFLSGRKKNVDR